MGQSSPPNPNTKNLNSEVEAPPEVHQTVTDPIVLAQRLGELRQRCQDLREHYGSLFGDLEQYQSILEQVSELYDRYHPSHRTPSSDASADISTTVEMAQMEMDMEAQRLEADHAQYDRLGQDLRHLEQAIELHLFSWKDVGHPFWQVVRFLGLGLVLGWWLRGCAG